MYNKNSQSSFKNLMLKSSLFDCSNAYILGTGTITTDSEGDNNVVKQAYERNKRVIFKNCSPITHWLHKQNK